MCSPVDGAGPIGACGASVLIGVPSSVSGPAIGWSCSHDVGAGDEVRVLGQLGDPVHGRAGDVDLEQEVDPLLLRAGGEDPGELAAQREVAARVLAELLAQVALEQILTTDRAAEALEEVALRRLEQDGAVVGRVVVLVPHGVAHRRRPVLPVALQPRSTSPRRSGRALHATAASAWATSMNAPSPVARARVDRGEHADAWRRARRLGCRCPCSSSGSRGSPRRCARPEREPAVRVVRDAVGGEVAERAGLAEARRRAEHERGVHLAEPLVAEPALGERAGPHAFDHHLGTRARGRGTPRRLRGSGGRGRGCASRGSSAGAGTTARPCAHAPDGVRVVAPPGHLDLDDVGTEVGEVHPDHVRGEDRDLDRPAGRRAAGRWGLQSGDTA